MKALRSITPVRVVPAIALTALFATTPALAETVRIAYIDPLSGTFAATGENVLNSWRLAIDIANREKWAGDDVKFEIAGFDNKASPQESLVVLRKAIDQGYRYVAQGFGSGSGLALIDAVNKHNTRNPGKEIVYLNTSAGDPDMTNSKCSFWHFRLDANSDMKIEVLTSHIAQNPNIKKVYLLNPDYAFGRQVTKAARAELTRKRPDIQIVGDDLHPFGQVKDFTPYVAKIASSGAEAVITGNAGTDLVLLVKAANDNGLKADLFTLFAASVGVPAALGPAGEGRVKAVPYWHPNNETFSGQEIVEEFRGKYKEEYYSVVTYTGIKLLSEGIRKSASIDPIKVALAMEGMKVQSLNGEVEMRKADHQLQQPLYIASWVRVDGQQVKYDQEGTGFGWKTDFKTEASAAALPTSCQMTRPSER